MDEQILTAVETALRNAGLLRRGAVLLVALSGGADSVLLLRTVCALAEKHGFIVRAAHVEHGLRGEASLRDADFCKQLCEELGVPYTCDHASLTGGMDDAGAETRARKARYALLLSRAKDADALLTAHHQDDQAETVLAHLLRGSGARGLAGMRPVSARDGVTMVRPLLGISKQAILQALGSHPYCEDESNALPCCQRNRLRTDVIPLLARENPRAAAHMAQSAALLRLDDDYLQSLGDALLEETLLDTPPFFCLRKAPLLSAPDAVAVRALRAAAEQAMALVGRPEERGLSAGDSLRLLSLLPSEGALNLPQSLRAVSTAGFVHFVRMADGQPLAPCPAPLPVAALPAFGTVVFGDCSFELSPSHLANPPDGLQSVVLPTVLLKAVTLRTSRTGDRIRPFGAPGSKLLRRYLIDRKVDAPFRPRIPLLCRDDTVLWACGVGAAEETRISSGAPCTLIRALSPFPWQLQPTYPPASINTKE